MENSINFLPDGIIPRLYKKKLNYIMNFLKIQLNKQFLSKNVTLHNLSDMENSEDEYVLKTSGQILIHRINTFSNFLFLKLRIFGKIHK